MELGDTLHGDGGSVLESVLPRLRSVEVDHSESGKGLRERTSEGGREPARSKALNEQRGRQE